MSGQGSHLSCNEHSQFMELIASFADLILHVDKHLQVLAAQYGVWLYGILFTVVFCETGLVVMPLLPGDSLLFAAGSLASMPATQLDPHLLFAMFSSAAILGDSVNYWIGRSLGPKVFQYEKSRFFNPAHLEKHRRFLRSTGSRPSSSPGSSPSFAPFLPSWRGSAPCVIRSS